MTPRGATAGSLLFVLVGPGLEAGVGPLVLTGFQTSDGLPGGWLPGALGVLLLAAGLAGLVAAFTGFAGPGQGTPSPAAPPQRLVVTGVYRHVRNPMYVATAAVIVGEGLLLRQPILLAGAALYLATLWMLTRVREEPALLARFGADYAAYRDAVGGWLPRRPRSS